MTIEESRIRFAHGADSLAAQAGCAPASRLPEGRGMSRRFVWYMDDEQLTLVVGDQEERFVDLALAVGLGERAERLLRLVLPRGWHEPTLHRWPWLREDLPLEVWGHAAGRVVRCLMPGRAETTAPVGGSEEPQLHLGDRTSWVESLMRWAGDHRELDAGHRRDVRAWHCRGQRVLKIRRTGSGLGITGGIDWSASSPHPTPVPLSLTAPLTEDQEREIKTLVVQGCEQRLTGTAKRADEHWLQAVLRRHPRVLGLEQPVLRELPAWRPAGSASTRGGQARARGYVDLVGLDATGTLTLVETKLGPDHMLVLQALDYRIWAEANRQELTMRLDCRPTVPIEMAICVGGPGGENPTWTSYTGSHLSALAPDLRWHVQEVRGWTGDSAHARRSRLCSWPPAPT